MPKVRYRSSEEVTFTVMRKDEQEIAPKIPRERVRILQVERIGSKITRH